MKKKNNNKQRWIIGSVLVPFIIGLIWTAFKWADYNSYLSINQIRIQGASIIEPREYLDLLGDITDTPIAQIKLDEIRSTMAAHPYVRAIRVSRHYPNTIKIELVERKPVAMVNIPPMVLIDEEGVILPETDKTLNFQLPCLSNFNPAKQLYPVGKHALSQKVIEATKIVSHIRREYPTLYRNLSEVRLNHRDEYELILSEEPTRIVLGSDDIWNKLLILKEFEKSITPLRKLTDYTYLDLRYENQVIARERHV
ncbi:MAG: FtsQ-type POTRA domain-containing protein [FCB group bacterium]|nr:FtsQ-type POTRA domain-containing protein [FCB group bacterium]